ncbi:hypothetical protein GOBAR_DD33864 [Gossypium barbadense]|nr:hypothetical protein GOBAR_DD33864 [Gossypium barbadense]
MRGSGVQRRERGNSTWRRARDRKTLRWLNRRNLREGMDETLPSQDNQSSNMEVNQEMRTRRNALGSSNPRYLRNAGRERPKQCGRWPMVHGDSEGKIEQDIMETHLKRQAISAFELLVNPRIRYFSIRSCSSPRIPPISWDMVRFYDPHLMIITETRACIGDVRNIVDNLPFDGCMDTRSIGYQDGIWLLWKSNIVTVEELCSTKQEIHALVKVRASSISWFLSAVYASPRLAERKLLWSNLKTVASKHKLPWIVTDDLMRSSREVNELSPLHSDLQWPRLTLDERTSLTAPLSEVETAKVQTCPICDQQKETIERLFRDCSVTKRWWNSIWPPMAMNQLVQGNFKLSFRLSRLDCN